MILLYKIDIGLCKLFLLLIVIRNKYVTTKDRKNSIKASSPHCHIKHYFTGHIANNYPFRYARVHAARYDNLHLVRLSNAS